VHSINSKLGVPLDTVIGQKSDAAGSTSGTSTLFSYQKDQTAKLNSISTTATAINTATAAINTNVANMVNSASAVGKFGIKSVQFGFKTGMVPGAATVITFSQAVDTSKSIPLLTCMGINTIVNSFVLVSNLAFVDSTSFTVTMGISAEGTAPRGSFLWYVLEIW
jgi:hypothetical protein